MNLSRWAAHSCLPADPIGVTDVQAEVEKNDIPALLKDPQNTSPGGEKEILMPSWTQVWEHNSLLKNGRCRCLFWSSATRDSNEELNNQITLHHNVFCLNLEVFLVTCSFIRVKNTSCLLLPPSAPGSVRLQQSTLYVPSSVNTVLLTSLPLKTPIWVFQNLQDYPEES